MLTSSTKKPLTLILWFLFAFCCLSFVTAAYLNSSGAFTLSGVALLLFIGIFAVGVLDYKVGGNQLTLEKRVNTLEKENTELKDSVTALAKSIYMISSENAPVYGFDHATDGLLDKYFAPVNHLIEGDIKATVEEDLKRLATLKSS
tara:strand:- start:256894 stop:257331 length:438 start_codon:yes stop_codon:yes gene_type:complete